MKTTLNKIREHFPCKEGWEKLLRSLNKTKEDDEPISIIQILDSNGLDDALWCLRVVSGHDREIRLFAIWCARQVQHLMKDQRSIDALDVSERFANGNAAESELAAAWDAASLAAKDAASDAAMAAACAAWATTEYFSWNAAKDAARHVARAVQEKELRRLCFEIESMEVKK